MTFLAALAIVIGAIFLFRRFSGPACPRCRAREWDRRLCAPLLFCRRCSTRVDVEGRAYN